MRRLLLVGNPNCGKTTLFNLLTGSSERVGNWHGVTVGEKSAMLKGVSGLEVVDLPGTYSLSANNPEEVATVKALAENDVVINVIEASRLRRSLFLTRQLLASGKRVMVVISMYSELSKRGGSINAERLSSYLGCPVIIASDKLKDALVEFANAKKSVRKKSAQKFGGVCDELPNGILVDANGKSNVFDYLFTTPIFGVIFFVAVMLFVFYSSFGRCGLGGICGAFLEKCIKNLVDTASLRLSKTGAFGAFVTDGLLGGVSSVVGFFPQLAVTYLCLIVIEESGYLPRVACLFDGLLKGVGLSGRAVFSLLVGFGCTAAAVSSSRATDNFSVKKRTVLALYFLPCMARLPVFSFIASAFFKENAFVVIALLYFGGCVMAVIVCKLSVRLSGVSATPLVIELPPFRIPPLNTTLKQLKYYLKTFIIKIGSVLLAVSAVVWVLRSFSPSLEFLSPDRIGDSILAKIGGAFSFVFAPIGISGWQMPVATMCGLIAKEGIISALVLVYPNGLAGAISVQSALAVMVFVAYYTPCVTASVCAGKEIGCRLSLFYGIFTLISALLSSYFVYGFSIAVAQGKVVGAIGLCVALALALLIITTIFKGRIDDKICSECKGKDCKNNCRRGRRALRAGAEAFARKGS